MSGLKHTMAAVPAGNTRRTYGTAYWDGSRWYANVSGNLLDARWNDPIELKQNVPIVVDITNDGLGQSSALVMGVYADQPRPSTGAVLTVGVKQIVIAGDDGGSYATARFVNPYVPGPTSTDPPRLTYAPGDTVELKWGGGTPVIIGIIAAAVVVPASLPPLPPARVFTGETTAIATATDTWGVGGWGRWAGSQNGGEDLYSGTWAGQILTGAWFYGAPKPGLAGKTITRIRFKLPARLNVGASGPATIHLYAHTSGSRPRGDVNRTIGPFDYTVPQGFAGKHIDLPLSFAPALIAGGGISIAGHPYAGFKSRLDDPESGKLVMNWRA